MEAIQGCVVLVRMSARTCPARERILTERKNIDEQCTWKGTLTCKLYQIFGVIDFRVIEPPSFVSVPYS